MQSTTHDGWGTRDNLPLRESRGSQTHVQAATLVVTVVDRTRFHQPKTLSQKENVNMSLSYLVAVGSAVLAVIFIAVSAFLIWYYFYMTKKRNEGGRMGFTQTKGTVSAETDENGDLTWGD